MFDYKFLYYNRKLSKEERIGLLLYDKGFEIKFRAGTNRKLIDLAIKYYMLSANKYNNVFAMESMADEYVRGENINRDIRVAMNYHIKAVKLGYYPSMVKLAFCYLNLNKYAKAHELINNICKIEKNIIGNYILGICYYWGLGVKRNIYKAFELFAESNQYKDAEIKQDEKFDYDPRYLINNYHNYGIDFYNGLLILNGFVKNFSYSKYNIEYYNKAFDYFENELENNKYFNIELTKYVHNNYLSRERLIDILKENKNTSIVACVNYLMISNFKVDDIIKEKN